MSKTWEHHSHAARPHARAAYHFNQAAQYNCNKVEGHEKATHDACLAQGHGLQAILHETDAARLHAELGDTLRAHASEPAAKKVSAA